MTEALILALVGGLAFWSGYAAYRAASPVPHFYQAAFGPAAMVAAGAGFVNPEAAPGGVFEAFLGLRRDSITPADVAGSNLVPADQFQNAHRYLLILTGWWWGLTGISWAGIAAIAAAMHMLSALGAYALLRLLVPRGAAVAGALWFSTAPLQLAYVPHFRDYSKAPFVMATLALLTAIVLHGSTRRLVVGCAAAIGVTVGIGFGFKMDLAALLPVALVCLVLFVGQRPWTSLMTKGLATAALVVAFTVTAWPVLSRLASGGTNLGHVVLLGYSDWFDRGLGIERAPYRFIADYSDAKMIDIIRAREEPRLGRRIDVPSPEYHEAGLAMWGDVLRHFPADFLTRTLGAIDGIVNLAFLNPTDDVTPTGVQASLRPVYRWVNGWHGWGIGVGIVTVLAAARIRLRLAGFAAVMVIAVAGYPSLQFDPRHYFHLQIVPLAMLSWLAYAAMQVVRFRVPSRTPDLVRRPVTIAASCLLLLAVPVWAARAYQAGHVRDALTSFVGGLGSAVNMAPISLADGNVLVQWHGMSGRPLPGANLSFAYHVAEFAVDQSHTPLALTLRYRVARGFDDCPRVLTMTSGPGTARFAFPVYHVQGQTEFEGIELERPVFERLRGVYQLAEGPLGLPLELRLPAEWGGQQLFQQLRHEPWHRPQELAVRIASPTSSPCGAESDLVASILSPRVALGVEAVAKTFTTGVSIGPNGIVMNGKAESASSYVMQFKPVKLSKGDALVAHLSLEQGGMVIGLLKGGAWYGQVVTTRLGDSLVAVTAAEEGEYEPLIAHALPSWRRASRFAISHLGVARVPGT